MTLPWGGLSSLKLDCRSQSDDGPIMWVRPGEQMVPTADMPKSPFKRRRYASLLFLINHPTNYHDHCVCSGWTRQAGHQHITGASQPLEATFRRQLGFSEGK